MVHQTIYVTDVSGCPVTGAAIIPYPVSVLPFGSGAGTNLTDSQGRVEIYDVSPGDKYTIRAAGLKTREISFPRADDTTYVLRRRK